MIWRLNNKTDSKKVVFSLSQSEVRLFLIENNLESNQILSAESHSYQSQQELSDICAKWVQKSGSKRLNCYWLLTRDCYKAIQVKKPNAPEAEIDAALKWLVKDQVDLPLERLLVTHYVPVNQDSSQDQLTAIIVEKDFIENLIQTTEALALELHSIEISELTAGCALKDQFEDKSITGLIDEDSQGLVYNFYVGSELAFTRHIKRRYFPQQEETALTLENDNYQEQLDRFLLETQRTIDYCVSQIFRRPINKLIVDASKLEGSNLIDAIETTLDIPVSSFDLNVTLSDILAESDELQSIGLSIDELGLIQTNNEKKKQYVDLYLPQYRPQPLEFGFSFAASVASLFLFGFIVLGIIENSEVSTLEDKLKETTQIHNEVQTSMLALQKKLKEEGKIEDLNKIIAKKQKELVAVKRLLVRVNNQATTKPVDYSKILKALSSLKSSSLWLTKINLYPTSLSLVGQTTQAKLIPNYISKMAEDKLLSSRFEDLSIERDAKDKRLIHFKMTGGRYNHAE